MFIKTDGARRMLSVLIVGFVVIFAAGPAAGQYTTGDKVNLEDVGEVIDILRLGFRHWAHASGDPDPSDTHDGINDVDDSVGDHGCTFTTTPYSVWDPIAEEYGASHWPFTLDPNNVMNFTMTAPESGQYVIVIQTLVNTRGKYYLEFQQGGQWNTVLLYQWPLPFPPGSTQYMTMLYSVVVETDPGQTQIPMRIYSTDYKMGASGIVLARLAEDAFADSDANDPNVHHGNAMFTPAEAVTLWARWNASSMLYSRYLDLKSSADASSQLASGYYDLYNRGRLGSYREKLVNNALISAIDGDTSRRDQAVQLLEKVVGWGDFAPAGTLRQGDNLRALAIAYDHLYQYLTPTQRDQIRRKIDREARLVYLESITQDWWSVDTRANNWQAVIHSGLAAAGLALRNESRYAQQYGDWGKYQCKNYIHTTFTDSGSCREAYGTYYSYGLGSLTRYIVMLKNISSTDPNLPYENLFEYDDSVIVKTVPFSLYIMNPMMDGFAPFDDTGPTYAPIATLASIAYNTNDPLAQWLVKYYVGEPSGRSSWLGRAMWQQLWYDPNQAVEFPDSSPRMSLAKAFIEDDPTGEGRWGSGHVSMRTGFESDDDIAFVLQCGDSGGYHGHADQGSFALDAYNGHLVSHVGSHGSYSGAGNAWAHTSKGNSVVLIDGEGQVNNHQFGNGRMTRDGTVDDFYHDENIGDYALANSKPAYDDGNRPVDHALRHVMFIRKPNRQGYFVIADDIQSATVGGHDYSWLLHSRSGVTVTTDQADASFRFSNSQSSMDVMFATPQSVTMQKIISEDGASFPAYVKTTANSDRGVFVALLFPESDRLGIYTPTVTRIDDGNLAGFELGGDLVLFNKAGGLWTYQDVQSDAQMIYLDRSTPGEISYLVAGATTLHVDGEEIFSAPTATTASGTIVDTEPPTLLAWYSAKTHDRGVGEVLLEIADDDDDFSDPRSGGIGKLVLEFSEVMDVATFTSSTMRVVGYDANHLPVDLSGTTITCQASGDGSQCEITFVPALPDYARYAMDIAGVTDLGGNPLAGDSDRIFSALEGDISQDLRVNVSDLSLVRGARTTLISSDDEAQVRADITCDGRVNVTDLSRVRANRDNNLDTIGNPNPNVGSFDEEADGEVTIQAEEVGDNVPAGSHAWQQVVSPGGFDGVGAMAALPDNGTRINSRYEDSSPELTYSVQFDTPGTWYVWVRGYGTVGGNTVHVGLSGLAVETSDRIGPFAAGEWTWTNATLDMDGNAPIPATFEIDSPGVYPVNVWMREDGFIIDKLILHHGPGMPAEVQADVQVAPAPAPAGETVDNESPTILTWHSAKTHARGVGEVLLDIPDTDAFCDPRSGGISRLIVEFSEVMDVTSIAAATVAVAGNDANGLPIDLAGVTATAQASGDGSQCEITFSPALPDYARYAVHIADVTDLAGNALAGDSDRIFSALEGDIFQDLRVNVSDLSLVRLQRTSLISSDDEAQVRADISRDGRVNVTDLSRVRANYGRSLRDIGDPDPHFHPFLERDGIVVVEIESAPPTDGWRLETNLVGYSGEGYYTWRGPNLFNRPGTGMLAYPVRITKPGQYRLSLHNRHDDPDYSKSNDVFVRVDDGIWIKVFSHQRRRWNWDTKQDPDETTAKPPAIYELAAGDHVLYISGRSADFSIDRFHLYLLDVPDPTNLTRPQSPRA